MSDESKRRIYDKYGEEGLNVYNGNQFDFFSQKIGKDISKDLYITLEEAYNGGKKELEYNRNILYPKCKGKGYLKKIIKVKCEECNNEKYKNVKNKIIIEIEKGIPDGYEHLEKGEGDECLEGEAGDLLITIHIKKESNIERKGADLFYSCNISLLESLTGFKVLINYLSNKKILIKNKPGELIKHGMIKYVGKFGMPFLNHLINLEIYILNLMLFILKNYPKNKM